MIVEDFKKMTIPAQIVVYENFEFNKVVDHPSGIGTTIATTASKSLRARTITRSIKTDRVS